MRLSRVLCLAAAAQVARTGSAGWLGAAAGQVARTGSAGAAPKPTQLRYFDARGAAELTRVLLAVGEVTYVDTRFSIIQKDGKFETPEFAVAKEDGSLAVNMNRVPVLVLEDGTLLGQSKAMERYVSRHCNLLGKTEIEGALIDCVVENVRDIKDRWGKIRSIGGMGPSKEKDEATTKFLDDNDGEYLQFLRKLESSLPASRSPGFAVGSALSYADFAIWNLCKDTFLDEVPKSASLACLATCPGLLQIVASAESCAALGKYLKARKVTKF